MFERLGGTRKPSVGGVPFIRAYGLDWHTKKSPAFQDLVVSPLQSFLSIGLEPWDEKTLPKQFWRDVDLGARVCIFFQLPPTPEAFDVPGIRLVWIPMWDQARGYSAEWWDALPKSLRIVSFSDAITRCAERAGLEVLRLKYFKDPSRFAPCSWNHGRILMYWNRTGLVGPEFLERLCLELRVSKLIFQSECDPSVPSERAYGLPNRLGGAIVEEIPSFLSREEYLKVISEANLYLAPRVSEGVGMTFLEAMARGCGVLAYDAPTMNEYIEHGRSGYLLKESSKKPTLLDRAMRRISRKKVTRSLTMQQDWASLRTSDWQALGNTARHVHLAGYQKWQISLSSFARFIESSNSDLIL